MYAGGSDPSKAIIESTTSTHNGHFVSGPQYDTLANRLKTAPILLILRPIL
jgi:hypothetical protein